MQDILLALIIGILIFNYLLDRLLDYLNIRNKSQELPEELEGIYDAEKYKKSREYDAAKRRFSIVSGTFSLAIILLMLLPGGFAWVDHWVRSFTTDPILMALAFFGVLFLASDILGLPFSIYFTFVLEEKFGFNRTTVKTFISDKIKQYILGALIGGGLLALFVLFYQWVGQNFWIYAWLALSVFMILTTMFYASVLLPLFNKLPPLPEGELRTAIENYCREVDFQLDNLFVMDGSKRSAKANAFFSGLGAKKRIVLYDTLINNHTTEELVAVLAHEIGHYKKKHTLTGIVLGILQTGVMLYLLSWFISNPVLSAALGISQHSFHIGLLVFGMLYTPISMVLSVIMNMLSRKNEFEADRYAAETFDATALQNALKKLSANNLSDLQPHPLDVFLNYSHPPLLQRLRALQKAK